MLRSIHKASSTWLGKIVMAAIMGTLVVAFAIWGINDIFRGFGRSEVATVGNSEISIEQFRQFYNDQIQNLSRQTGRVISPAQARALGLDRQILGQLIIETALDQQVRSLRLGLGNDQIATQIESDPKFRGPSGQFDRQVFAFVINRLGFSEPRYVEEQRRQLLRRQIGLSISGDLRTPVTALEAVNRYRNETRSIDYLTLGPAQAGDIPAPAPEALTKYFDERKTLFRAPEYRKLTILSVTPASLAKPETVSDADAKAYYEPRKDQYGKPEKREVRQIIFPNAEDAAAAREKIAKGASFDAIVKERGLKPGDTDLGLVTKSAIINPAVAQAAFSLKSGEVSQPIKGNFGTVLVTVGKIEAGEPKTYDDVAQQIKREIAEARARSQINSLRDKIEDEKASGATLIETAKKLGLTVQTIDAVDRAGQGPNGQPAKGVTPNVVAAAFASDVGVDNEALPLPGGGFLYFDVTGITPSRERTLDEVKDKVTTAWRNDEIAKRLKAKSDDMLAKLKSGRTLEQVAAGTGLTVQKAADLKRGAPAGFVPARVVDAVFHTAKDAPAVSTGATETEYFVFRVTAVTEPKFDANSPEAKQLSAVLQNAYADDLINEYLAWLEQDIGVSINQSAVNQVVGGGEPGG